MSSRASRPRSRRRLVGVSAVAVGALLTTYAGGLRQVSYAQAQPVSAFAGCSPGAIPAADDTALQAAISNSVDGAVICITDNITVSRTLILDDTSVTLEADDSTVELSGGGVTRVLYADFRDSADDTLILRYLTITQGTSLNADDSDGGAVLVTGSSRADSFIGEYLTVTDSYSFEDGGGIALSSMEYIRLSGARFYDDSAASDSGAFEVNFADSVVIENSTFKRNTAISEQGGAFEFQDVLDLRVSSSEFAENEAGDDGGSIQVFSGSDYVRLSNTSFLDDSSGDDGGSVALESIATLRIDNVSVAGGQAADVGGGVFLSDDTDVEITNSTFTNNTSLNSGGGVFVSAQRGPITLTDVRAYDNTSSTGSGGFLRMNPAIDVTVTRLTSRGNEAGADGGSIKQTAGTLTLSDSTFQDDSASDSGALFLTGLSVANISGSSFIGNRAVDDAGAVRVIDSGSAYISSSLFHQNQVTVDDGGGLLINNVDDTVSLSSVTFDRNTTGAEGGGAKIVNSNGVVALNNITATGNSAGTNGGAVYINRPSNSVIENSTFTSNEAGRDGGAIWLEALGQVTMSNVTATQNTAVRDGGAVYAYLDDGPLTVMNVTWAANLAGRGGGALYVEGDGDAAVTVENSTIEGNAAAARAGGGIYIDDVDTVAIRNSSFIDDTSALLGGAAFFVRIYTSVDIEGSTFTGNHAPTGGAVVASERFTTGVVARQGAPMTVVNTTFTGNSADDSSGAVRLVGETHSFDFVTMSGNSASVGGGISMDDTATALISNSIIAGNQASISGGDVSVSANSTLDDSFSLFTSAAAISGATADGPGTVFGAPRLNGLADNGGPTSTMLPQWDSPAFQAGDPSWTAPPANDQRGAGFPRNAGGRVSMGAIQGRSAQPPVPVTPPSAPREVSAAAGDGEALVSWTAPATSGSFPITTYEVEDPTGEFTCLVEVAPGEPLACVIEDLTNGVAYTFRVRALNGAGWGAWSAFTDPVTPRPGASILITGSREGRSVRVVGEAPGLEGDALIPRLRFSGPNPYADGKSRPVVDEAGEFTWQRRANKKVYVYFFAEDRDVRSNRVIIPARR